MSHTNKYNTLYPLLYHDNPRAVSKVVLESGGDPIGRRGVVNFRRDRERVGRFSDGRMREMCAALAVAVDCQSSSQRSPRGSTTCEGGELQLDLVAFIVGELGWRELVGGDGCGDLTHHGVTQHGALEC